MLVAIDTSTDIASLALVEDASILAELTWRSHQNHTVQLLPNLEHLLKLTGFTPADLTGVVVAKGPGSFNGLRVGISAAKGLAFSLNIPIVGIDSLEVEAYQYAYTGLPICPIFNAGRNEITTALFQKHTDGWKRLFEDQITTVDKLVLDIKEKTLFCGEYLPAVSSELVSLLGDKAVVVSPTTDIRRASYLAGLGKMKIDNGEIDNAATLQPIYLRRPPITIAKHK
ncbi:MAG: tRNA (adenosine(37)-N6)-threonylcarbamoyltransferase complex dimerization subunit type 1 TsaB [Chloroflexi bacterium RBG_13_46_9]|nr:MAG: tRNA (adenosine(37)-N6)-threonylcarbamoyltransferase complex dimerization subunit type 1 TsaB [Chloroflexi bacterium RBG_13_46_9]